MEEVPVSDSPMEDSPMSDAPAVDSAADGAPVSAETSSPSPATVEGAPVSIDCYIGIDLGSGHTVVSLIDADKAFPSLAVNDLSNRSTPTIVSFRDGRVFVGEAGAFGLVRSPATTFASFKGDLGHDADAMRGRSIPFSLQLPNVNEPDLGSEDELNVTPVVLCALFFAHLTGDVRRYEAMLAGRRAVATRIAVPTHFSAFSRALVEMAARIAGLPEPACVSEADALAVCYHRRHHSGANETDGKKPEKNEISEKKKVDEESDGKISEEVPADVEMPSANGCVLLVDVGERYTSVLACAEGGGVVLAEHTVDGGAADFDEALATLAASSFEAKFNEQGIMQNARFKQRFLAAADRAKHVLSTIEEAFFEVENIRDHDLKLRITRAQMEEHCEPVLARVSSAIAHVREQLGASRPISTVELVGGGTRIPCVQRAIRDALGPDIPLSHTLDSSAAVSFGAALLCRDQLLTPTPSCPSESQPASESESISTSKSTPQLGDLDESVSRESFMRIRTKHEYVVGAEEQLNRLEGLLAATREHLSDPELRDVFAAPGVTAAVERVLAQWRAFADEHSTCQDFEFLRQKLSSAREEIFAAAPGLEDALNAKEAVRREALQEAERRQAAKAASATSSNRKASLQNLSVSERLSRAEHLRAQGNALFKELDYEAASTRYVSALAVLAGGHDIPANMQVEISELRQVCLVNLAVCLLKLERYRDACERCSEALKLNERNVKALFRRGQAYNRMKEYELAAGDLRAALEGEPKAKEVQRELQAAEVGIRAMKEKQKKMYTKMFS